MISVAGPRYPLPRPLTVAPNQRLSTVSCLLVVRMRSRQTAALFVAFEIDTDEGGIWAALSLGGCVGAHEGLAFVHPRVLETHVLGFAPAYFLHWHRKDLCGGVLGISSIHKLKGS